MRMMRRLSMWRRDNALQSSMSVLMENGIRAPCVAEERSLVSTSLSGSLRLREPGGSGRELGVRSARSCAHLGNMLGRRRSFCIKLPFWLGLCVGNAPWIGGVLPVGWSGRVVPIGALATIMENKKRCWRNLTEGENALSASRIEMMQMLP